MDFVTPAKTTTEAASAAGGAMAVPTFKTGKTP